MIRPVVEYAAPLWHSGLTASDSLKLEAIQKKAIGLILGVQYVENRRYYRVNGQLVSYETALAHCKLDSLEHRREILTSKFAIETAKNERHHTFFDEKIKSGPETRSKSIVEERTCNTERHRKSAIPCMSRLLNK